MKHLILSNVPSEMLIKIEDEDTEFENVTPLEMMTHLWTNAQVTDVFDKKQLLDALNKPVNFDGDLPLKGHFKNVDATIKLLKKHSITASKSIVMVTILKQIRGHGDFKEEVSKWELKPLAMQTWIDFKTYFSAANHKCRQQDQYGAKTARTVGASANHVTTIADLKMYIDDNLLALAQATTAGINAVMDQPPVATANAAATSTASALEDKVKAHEAELKHIMAGKGSSTHENKGEKKMARVKCVHCNWYHPNVPADKCWGLVGNHANKLEGWKPKAKKQE